MEPVAVTPQEVGAEAPDLSVLERIEGELHAVERALEQIDQGAYAGFLGLDDVSVGRASPPPAADTAP